MREIKEFLTKIGVSSKEIEVYLTGLKNGPMHATDIAKECKLTRPNAYDVIKKLQAKGLVSQLGHVHGRKFKMANAEELQRLVDRQTDQQLAIKKQLQHIIPYLNSIQGNYYESLPKLEFFEGIEGIRELVAKSLQANDEVIKTATSVISFVDLLGYEFVEYYVNKRVEKNKHSLTLRSKKGEVKDPFFMTHKKHLREVRFPPKEVYLSSTMMLYDNCIAMITDKKEKLGILLVSESYSKMLQSWFDFIWSQSKES